MLASFPGDSGVPERRNIFPLDLTLVFSTSFPQMSPGICCIPWLAVEAWAPRTYCCCAKFGGFGVGAEIFLYILTFRFYKPGPQGALGRDKSDPPALGDVPTWGRQHRGQENSCPQTHLHQRVSPLHGNANLRASIAFFAC